MPLKLSCTLICQYVSNFTKHVITCIAETSVKGLATLAKILNSENYEI